MSDEELAEKVGRALYTERPLELDQDGGDDWDILPDEWREEWIDAGRVAVAAVKKARRLTRPRPQRSEEQWVTAPDGEEFRVGQCQGHAECPVKTHEHGCYADVGNCDHPEDHKPDGRGSDDA